MRRIFGAAAVFVLLLGLSGCGAGRRASRLHLVVAVATGGLLAAPVYLGVKVGGVQLVPERVAPQKAAAQLADGSAVAAVVSPLDANRLTGDTLLMRLSSGSDLMLLWRQQKVFHWGDLKAAGVLTPVRQDQLFSALLGRYKEAVKEPPTLIAGPASAFWLQREGDFLLVHEPLASQVVLTRKGLRAVSLGVEAGPYPAAVLAVKTSVLQEHESFFRTAVKRLWHNEIRLQQGPPEQLAGTLQPFFPLVSPQALQRSVLYARTLGLFPSDPRVLLPVSPSRLEHVFPGTDFSPLKSRVDGHLAAGALLTIP